MVQLQIFHIMDQFILPGPPFRSILSLTLSWNNWLVSRIIHKYERFFSNKVGSENRSLECSVLNCLRQ
jgi:hypothetical protein